MMATTPLHRIIPNVDLNCPGTETWFCGFLGSLMRG
jgi:hypothetical protein